MQQTFEAKVIRLEHFNENGVRRSVYTLEYEENGELRQITAENEPSSWVEEGAVIDITVEDGRLLRTGIRQATLRHNLMLIAGLLLFCAAVFGWIALIVFTKSNLIRFGLIGIGVLIWHLLTRSR